MRHSDLRPRTPPPMSGSVVAKSLVRKRVLGVLTGLTLGDALGMPTQPMNPAQIRQCCGEIIGLRDAVTEQPIVPLVPAGGAMDGAEQALILTGFLIDGGGCIDPHQLADALLCWENDICACESLDLLGPSTKFALERVRAGVDPHCTGRKGTTNSTVMWVALVGIAFFLSADGDALAQAVQASRLATHDTRQDFEVAELLIAAVSAAIDGVDTAGTLEVALDLVIAHPEAGHWMKKASAAARARLALEMSRDLHGEALTKYLRTYVGAPVEPVESVPCALVTARESAQRPLDGLYFAAELRGDIDTIVAMADVVLGAGASHPLPVELVDRVLERSGLRLEPICDALLALRDGGRCQQGTPGRGRP